MQRRAGRGWLHGRPFLVQRDARAVFRHAVTERLAGGGIDVLHADQLTMAQYLPLARGHNVRTVFDAHNAVWQLVQGLATRQPTPAHRAAAEVEWRLLRRFEGEAARSSDLTLAVSADDERLLAIAAGAPLRSMVTPIGIEAQERQPVAVRAGATSLLSVATMHYPPNAEAMRWFRDEIWPIVRAATPVATVDIAGTRPPQDLRDWATQEERVNVHGFVEDIEPLYERAAVCVVPLRAGSGVRVKILEALAAGVPVVSTSVGAEGLELVPGTHLLIADEPREFAHALLTLLTSPARRSALAAAGRARVLERYDWRVCCQPLLDAYRSLALPTPAFPRPTTTTDAEPSGLRAFGS
jgi:glycosyltransferase involved in cell wall biosynthesis